MGDAFRKVRRGDRLRIPADTYNAFIDAAEFVKQQAALGADAKPRIDRLLRIKNTTGAPLVPGAVAVLDTPLIDANTEALAPAQKPVVNVKNPGGTDDEQVVVMTKQVDQNAVEEAGVAAGLVWARVQVMATSHTKCKTKSATTAFESSDDGQYRIAWKPGTTGLHLCLVQLSVGGGGGVDLVYAVATDAGVLVGTTWMQPGLIVTPPFTASGAGQCMLLDPEQNTLETDRPFRCLAWQSVDDPYYQGAPPVPQIPVLVPIQSDRDRFVRIVSAYPDPDGYYLGEVLAPDSNGNFVPLEFCWVRDLNDNP